ncbi:MAG: GntR family transcriptional regulator [Acetobacteraceae bacterium]
MLRTEAYERFKERLFARALQPGQFVSQRELAELVGVSEGPMREALKRLEAEALVRLIPQRGVQVTEVSAALIRDAFGLRLALEAAAVRHFTRTASDGQLDELEHGFRRILGRLGKRHDPSLLDAALEGDLRFHETMIESMGNALISEVYRVNHDKIRLIRLNSQFTFDRLEAAVAEHLAIIAGLRARDADAALAALERHLNVSLRRSLGIPE